MLLDHDVSTEEAPDKINSSYIAKLCAEDWGIYKTFTMNLDRIPEFAQRLALGDEQRNHIMERAESIRKSIESAPKSMGWRMRATVGERKRWYELPELDGGRKMSAEGPDPLETLNRMLEQFTEAN
jgi:hypothetical protein